MDLTLDINFDLATDTDLLLMYREGMQDALDALHQRHWKRLVGLAEYHVRSREEAEDAVQDAFLSIVRYIHKFDPTQNAVRWINTIVVNRCRDILRTKKRRTTMSFDVPIIPGCEDSFLAMTEDVDAPMPHEPMMIEESRRSAKKLATTMLNSLDDHSRAIIRLIRLEGKAYKKAGEELGICVGTVKSRLHEAVKRAQKPRHRKAYEAIYS